MFDQKVIEGISQELKINTLSLIEECRNYDPLSIMVGILKFNPESIYVDQLSEVNLEFLQSILLGISDYQRKDIDEKNILFITDKIAKISQNTMFLQMGVTGLESKENFEESFIKFQTVITNMVVRGDSYPHHHKDLFFNFFSEHDKVLKEIIGFDSKEIIDFTEKIVLEQGEKIQNVIGIRPMLSQIKEISGIDSLTDIKIPEFLRSHFDSNSNNFDEKIFEISSEIPEKFKSFFALGIGENKGFIDSKFPGSIMNPTLITSKPLIEIDSSFYCFKPNLLFRNIFDICEALIKENKVKYYGRNYLSKKGKKLEEIMFNYFKQILPKGEFYETLYYYPEDDGKNRSEADGLILYNNNILLLEAKSGILTDPAKRGSIIRLKRDLGKLLDDAYEQAIRTKRYIENSSSPKFYDEKGNLSLEISNKKYYNNIFLINVTLENLTNYSNEHKALKKMGMFKEQEWFWTIFINDLRVISELNEFEAEFIHYLKKRIEMNEKAKYKASDELDIYLYYLINGFFSQDDDLNGIDVMFLSNFTEDLLDPYYTSMNSELKPSLKIPVFIKDFIFKIKECSLKDKFINFLLEINRQEIDEKISQNLEKLIVKYRQGRDTDMTIYYKDIDQGVTFAFASTEQSRDNFRKYAQIKKYEIKSKSWFLVFVNSNLESELEELDFEWKPDILMETNLEAFKNQRTIKTKIKTKGKKIGRNEKCPCGSNKKYKKCCGK